MIGACGGIGSTVALGLVAMRRSPANMGAMVTALPIFEGLELVDPRTIVVGGHEIRKQTLLEAVRENHDLADLFDEELIRACAPELRAMQRNIRPGTLHRANRTIRRLAGQTAAAETGTSAGHVRRLARDLTEFRRRQRLQRVVVVNVASSEPPAGRAARFDSYAKLQRALESRSATALPASSLYALAAIETGCAYVNFTPSIGIDIPALQERAAQLGALHMGRDGKTGETLVKSVLAPMFAMRNLRVLSWVGHNILGNRDGEVLADPINRVEKLKSKDQLLPRIIGYKPDSRVSIDYVRSLADWKIAWDFIHFEGFLGTRMSMQFTWQGSDSILAAPLVIDLVRLAALAQRRGETGGMRQLACFFKNPMGVEEQDYFSQWQRLLDHLGLLESKHV
jgi:myo-inositol-1-phosphate synthase